MVQVITKNTVAGDVVKWETHKSFTRVSRVLLNVSAEVLPDPSDIPNVIGLLLGGTIAAPNILFEADVANCIGFVVSGPPIVGLADDAATPDEYGCVIAGPALYNSDNLVATDPAGNAITMATAIAALAALNIKAMDTSPEVSEQVE